MPFGRCHGCDGIAYIDSEGRRICKSYTARLLGIDWMMRMYNDTEIEDDILDQLYPQPLVENQLQHLINEIDYSKSSLKTDYSLTKRCRVLDGSQTCGICLERMTKGDIVRKLPCGHMFHDVDCCKPWLDKNPSCPTCRERILR